MKKELDKFEDGKYIIRHIYKSSKDKSKYRYRIRYYPNKQQKPKIISKDGFNSIEEAEEALNYQILLIKNQLEENELFSKNTIGFLYKKYIEDLYNNQVDKYLKKSTVHHKEISLHKYLFKKFKKMPVSLFLKDENLNMFLNNFIETPISTSSKNRIMSETKQLFLFAKNNKLISIEDYATIDIKLRKLKDLDNHNRVKNSKFWTMEQYHKFIDSIDSYWKILYMVLGETGMRIGELRGLQLKHYDSINKTITIEQQMITGVGLHKSIIERPKTVESNRTIDISNSLNDTLKYYIKAIRLKKADNFIFFNRDKPIGKTTIERNFRDNCQKVGLPNITIHGLRHSFTTWLLSQTLTPQEIGQVSQMLGHSSITTTLDKYMSIHNIKSDKIVHFFDNINRKKED